jgi:hypothetical protein
LEKRFRLNQSRNTLIWGLVLLAIVDIPLMLFFFQGSKGPTFFYVIIGAIILIIDALILSLSFLGKKMSYKLGDDEFIVDFSFSSAGYLILQLPEFSFLTQRFCFVSLEQVGLDFIGDYTEVKTLDASGFTRLR